MLLRRRSLGGYRRKFVGGDTSQHILRMLLGVDRESPVEWKNAAALVGAWMKNFAAIA
jgi:hypothetical protein